MTFSDIQNGTYTKVALAIKKLSDEGCSSPKPLTKDYYKNLMLSKKRMKTNLLKRENN